MTAALLQPSFLISAPVSLLLRAEDETDRCETDF
jgi:hypothetical protein